MKAITLLSRHLSTVKNTKTLVSSIQNHPFLTEDSCFQLLDQCPDTKTLKKLHARTIITPQLHPNPPLSIKLMKVYAACGETQVTRLVFGEITEKNAVFFSVMISSYVKNHLFHDALLVYKTMTSCGFEPDNYPYPCVLKASSRLNSLRVGLQIHSTVVKVGLDSNLFIGNGWVAMYGKCGCLIEARRVLDEMPSRDVVSWNLMVAGYAQSGRFDDALEVCREMESLGVKPNAATVSSLYVKAVTPFSCHVSTVKKTQTLVSLIQNYPFLTEVSCFQLLDQCPDTKMLKKFHTQIIITPQLLPNLPLSIKLMRAYAACGETQVICHLFDEIAEENVLFFNVMIRSYVNDHLFHDALLVYKTLTSCGFEPAKYTYLCVLKVFSGLNCLQVGLQIHSTVVKVGLASNLFIGSGLVAAMYGKCGCLIEARRVLAEPNRNVVSWNSMVAGYVKVGGLMMHWRFVEKWSH